MNLFDTEAPAASVTLCLPLPPRALSPNGSHGHWRIKSEPTKAFRALVKAEALRQGVPPGQSFRLTYTFCTKGTRGSCPHNRRPRKDGKPLRSCLRCPYAPQDEPNALAAFKAGTDGIFDALGVKDSRKHHQIGGVIIDPSRGPCVEIQIEVMV